MAINQREIEQNIAERFDELSRGGVSIHEIEEGMIPQPCFFISGKPSASDFKEADDYSCKEIVPELFMKNVYNSKRSNSNSVNSV